MAPKIVLTLDGISLEERQDFLRALKEAGFEIEAEFLQEKAAMPPAPDHSNLFHTIARVFLEADPPSGEYVALLESIAGLAGCPIALFSPARGRNTFSCKAATAGFPAAWALGEPFPGFREESFELLGDLHPRIYPLRDDDLSAGALVAAVSEEGPSEKASSLLESSAFALGEAAARGKRLRDLDRARCLLESSLDAMVESCVRLLEFRGNETEGHGNRVTALAVKLGERMGLSGDELADLRRGALLHDIGKLTLPDSLMQKSDSLSEDDWKTMRSHTVRAFEAFRGVPALERALEVPLRHHERYNGSGYPGGLKGEEIPLAARIFSVVDIWDSLLSDRTYRRSWTPEKAMDHLQKGAGVQFDPDVVAAFASLLQEDPSLYKRPF